MTTFTTMTEITTAVQNGAKVCWKTRDYVVVRDLFGQWHVAHRPWSKSVHYVGLFWADGITSDYAPEDFFVAELAIV